MRALLALVLLPALAFAQSPPSKTLERAIKLYDKEDYLSSTIELHKVVIGQVADAPENVTRARFFLAKGLYKIGFYVPALAMFQKNIDEGGDYRVASFKWIAALRGHIPDAMLSSALSSATDADLADPTLASVRDSLLVIRGSVKASAINSTEIARNALACTHANPEKLREVIAKLLSYDDSIEIAEATKRLPPSTEANAITDVLEAWPSTRDMRVFQRELQAELELLQRADKAWQTTTVAAEVLQEVTVQHSVATADLGKLEQGAFQALDADLAKLGPGPFTPPERCVSPTLASGGNSPMVVSPPPKQGCGCETGSSASGLVVAFALLALIRRGPRRSAR